MSDKPHEIYPYAAIVPDGKHPYKDFRPRFDDPATVNEEDDTAPYGGLAVEDGDPEGEGSGWDIPKGDTVTVSVNSSKKKDDFPKIDPPATKGKSVSVASEDSQSKQDKDSPQTS